MNNTHNHNRLGNQGTALKALLNVLGFALALAGFFLLGFWVIGPHMQRGTTQMSAPHSDLSKDTNWTTAPEPPRPVHRPKPAAAPAAQVEVNEISHGSSTPTESSTVREADTLEQLSHSNETAAPSSPTEAPTVPTVPQKPRRFYVQAGVYAERTNAETLVSDLANQGYGASVRQVTRNGRPIYQVLVGRPKNRADAQLFADELRGTGKQVVLTPAE